jgi:hypothetical protein
MVETSAHLIDHVIPAVPVRQWVLSFPWPLRLLFARQPSTLSRSVAVIIRAIETDIIHRAVLTDGLLIPDPEKPWLELDFHEPIDSLSAASTEASDRRYRISIGPHSGSRTLTLHDPSFIRTDRPVKTLTADRDGFSLNAAVSCQPYQRGH